MPLMNGLDLLAWFKTQQWQQKIPFVLLTSSNDENDREQDRERGVDKYLKKPVGFEDLAQTVAAMSQLPK